MIITITNCFIFEPIGTGDVLEAWKLGILTKRFQFRCRALVTHYYRLALIIVGHRKKYSLTPYEYCGTQDGEKRTGQT